MQFKSIDVKVIRNEIYTTMCIWLALSFYPLRSFHSSPCTLYLYSLVTTILFFFGHVEWFISRFNVYKCTFYYTLGIFKRVNLFCLSKLGASDRCCLQPTFLPCFVPFRKQAQLQSRLAPRQQPVWRLLAGLASWAKLHSSTAWWTSQSRTATHPGSSQTLTKASEQTKVPYSMLQRAFIACLHVLASVVLCCSCNLNIWL